jgi:hypothetical protein
MQLREISGAMERPAACGIVVEESEGTFVVSIPKRGLAIMVKVTASLFTLVLLITFYTGCMLFFLHKPVLIVQWVTNGYISPPLLRTLSYYLPIWIGAMALGVWALISALRPSLTEEILVFDRDGITHIHRFLFSLQRTMMFRGEIRGFLLKQDPENMGIDKLTIEGQGIKIRVAEFARDLDREWLYSVGNTLLRS